MEKKVVSYLECWVCNKKEPAESAQIPSTSCSIARAAFVDKFKAFVVLSLTQHVINMIRESRDFNATVNKTWSILANIRRL